MRAICRVALPVIALASWATRGQELELRAYANGRAASVRLRVAAYAIVALTLSACSLPTLGERTATTAIAQTEPSALASALAPFLESNRGKSGIYPLPAPRDAFAARGGLARAAQRTIDVQYYIWHGDDTGILLFEALWQAAERGVRVRLLLDDINTSGLDETLAALDSHANLEVRLYNPLALRSMRLLNFVTSPRRVNRRMHNKSFTFDNQATIVGGRNIGDEYFGAGDGVAFEDLDVIAVGPIVHDVSASFDQYWNSASAYPAALLLAPTTDAPAALNATFSRVHADPRAKEYLDSLRETSIAKQLEGRSLPFEWTEVSLVVDHPDKTLDPNASDDLLLLPRMLEKIGRPAEQLDLVSPYFVPMKQGTEDLAALAASIKIRVLTNSLESTDVGAVHAGYAKRRKPLLRSGIQLFELKRGEAAPNPQRKSPGGSSAASLHAKTLAVDRRRVFVGSFNFDPRSARLNTELGLVFDSPTLAQSLVDTFDKKVPERAYEVRLSGDGKDLIWLEQTADGVKQHDTEPGTTWMRRFSVGFMSILPIEPLL
jgi:putative cardiolipin synthase